MVQEPIRSAGLRCAVLLYGWIAYAFFARTMIYFVGFSGDLLVSKTVDSGPPSSWPVALVWDTILLLSFFLPHSVMARQRWKDALFATLPSPVERSTYVLVASATLTLVMAAWRPLPYPMWDLSGTPAGALLRTISIAGWALGLSGSFSMGHRTLFGLKPAWDYFRNRPQAASRLKTSWLYARARHPMSLGFLIGMAATPRMSVGHLLLLVLFSGYVAVGIRYEERDLATRYGPAYAAYRNRVPRFGFSARRR